MNARAYAKINVGLRILRKREDGYHDIETIFHQVKLFDDLHFKLHEREVLLKTDNAQLPSDASNLCVKAAKLLRDVTGTADGVEIYLKKRIPVGAGLGGASSDAASTLKALRQLWRLDITNDELQSLALSLGSDVPFFLNGGTAYALGRGEQLESMILSIPYWIVVVTPPVHVSTAWAYKNIKRAEAVLPIDLRSFLFEQMNQPARMIQTVVNDFEEVVFPAYPQIEHLKRAFRQAGAVFVLMSGSGSSVFGFFDDQAKVKRFTDQFGSDSVLSISEPLFSPTQEQAEFLI